MDSKENAEMMHKAGAAKGRMNDEPEAEVLAKAAQAAPSAPTADARLVLLLAAASGYEARHEYDRITPEQWGDILRVCEGKLSSTEAPALAEKVAAVRRDALEEAALACEARGNEIVQKWTVVAGDEENARSIVDDAKARAWDALQCAAAIRSLATKEAAPAEKGQSQWISVEDRLPADETPVIVLLDGIPDIGELRWEHPSHEDTYQAFRYWDNPNNDGAGWEWDQITHWMPLPPAPAEVPSQQGGEA